MIPFFDYNLSTELPGQLPAKQLVINTLNPHSYCVAKHDEDFKKALQASDLLIPDGIGIVWGVKKIHGRQIKKIAGYDLHMHCLALLEKQGGGKVFYLGASQFTLDRLQEKLHREYPSLQVASFSPPFKAVFTEEDNALMREKVNAFAPDVLFVGMTAPKQEKWVHQNHELLNAKLIGAIGAVFDFYAETVQRPSAFWINLGLEFLPRFLKQPKKLFKRNFVSTPEFIKDVYLLKFKKMGSD